MLDLVAGMERATAAVLAGRSHCQADEDIATIYGEEPQPYSERFPLAEPVPGTMGTVPGTVPAFREQSGTLPAGPTATTGPFRWLGVDSIFAELPPVPWVCQELAICPGRPAMLCGFGFSGKTMAAQAMALAVATGNPIWGHFPCKRGKVLHLDYEQGMRATLRRYQRLAYGMDLTPNDIGDNLRVAIHPEMYLTTPHAYDVLCREVAGASLVIVDALRGSTVGIDENDSRMRTYVDMLGRVSEATDATFVLIHHAGKAKEGQTDMRASPRGSSAIFDGCGTTLMMMAENGTTTVFTTKTTAEATGKGQRPFQLAITDVCDEMGHNAGVRVAHVEIEQSAPETTEAKDEAHPELFPHIVEFIGTHPMASTKMLRDALPFQTKAVIAATFAAEAAGQIVNAGKPHRPAWVLPGQIEAPANG